MNAVDLYPYLIKYFNCLYYREFMINIIENEEWPTLGKKEIVL